MSIKIAEKKEYPLVSIPITIPQIAAGLRKLSKSELETLTFLIDKRAMTTIQKSRKEMEREKGRELK